MPITLTGTNVREIENLRRFWNTATSNWDGCNKNDQPELENGSHSSWDFRSYSSYWTWLCSANVIQQQTDQSESTANHEQEHSDGTPSTTIEDHDDTNGESRDDNSI